MQPYSKFAPTGFDSRGAFLDDRQDWLVVPVSVTRDSGTLDQSNFASATAALVAVDADGEDHEVHRFGHWGPGWFEIILVRPGSECARVAEEIEASLADYPVLDDADYSERENEYAEESWANMSIRDRVGVIQEHGRGVSIFSARHDAIPRDDCGRIYDYCRREN